MQTLRVYPNPFAALDKHGTPCGLCPRDPDADAGGPGLFVGARPDKKNTQILQDFAAINGEKLGARAGAMAAKGEIRSPMQLTRYEFMGVSSLDPELAAKLAAKDPIEIPATKYYKAELRSGSLIPADIETSRAAKLLRFVPPAEFFKRYAPAPLPETPGLEPLPDSPDAAGNLLEAPALPEGETREGVTLPADGVARTVEPEASAKPNKRTHKSEA
jgi:hypothetical protein